jgi:hypothetical protein
MASNFRKQEFRTISAKLFCKRSQVAFMPYGVVLKDILKDERPTSNHAYNCAI